jgi:histone H3/H4
LVPSPLDDRIRELCAKAVSSDDPELSSVMSELRSAMREHIEGIRTLAVRRLARESHVETKRESDNRERLRELAARIATEQDHDKFTALVRELNELLDGEESRKRPLPSGKYRATSLRFSL